MTGVNLDRDLLPHNRTWNSMAGLWTRRDVHFQDKETIEGNIALAFRAAFICIAIPKGKFSRGCLQDTKGAFVCRLLQE